MTTPTTTWAALIENHIILTFILIVIVILLITFLIYTYDRSFRTHQKSLKQVQDFNNKMGDVFVKQIHVGNDGTTIIYDLLQKDINKEKKT